MGIIAEFVESLTAAEQACGAYNFNFFGLIVEHPFVFWIFLPVFALGFLLGLLHARISGVVVVLAFIGIITTIFVIIGTGVPVLIVSNISVFFLSIPIVFAVGCGLGFLLRYVLRNACRNREGGILCKLV